MIDRSGRTALHLAAEFGDLQSLQDTLRILSNTEGDAQGKVILAEDHSHQNVLHHIARRPRDQGTPEETRRILQSVLDAGADAALLSKDVSGYTAAHRACYEHQTATALLLLGKMYDQDPRSLDWQTISRDMPMKDRGPSSLETCLHIAALGGLADVVTWLLEKGAKTDIVGARQKTAWEVCTAPLTQAVKTGSLENDTMNAFLRHYFRTEVSGDWFCFPLAGLSRWMKPSELPDELKTHLPPGEPALSGLFSKDQTYAASANNVSFGPRPTLQASTDHCF